MVALNGFHGFAGECSVAPSKAARATPHKPGQLNRRSAAVSKTSRSTSKTQYAKLIPKSRETLNKAWFSIFSIC
jgi:hypothetical protein